MQRELASSLDLTSDLGEAQPSPAADLRVDRVVRRGTSATSSATVEVHIRRVHAGPCQYAVGGGQGAYCTIALLGAIAVSVGLLALTPSLPPSARAAIAAAVGGGVVLVITELYPIGTRQHGARRSTTERTPS